MMTTIDIRTMSDCSHAAVSAGPRTVTIDRAKATGGCGWGCNGGELLLLAIGGGFSKGTTQEDILDLIQHPDRVAAIPNSLRFGAAVQLAEAKAIPLR